MNSSEVHECKVSVCGGAWDCRGVSILWILISFLQACRFLSPFSSGGGSWAGSSWGSPAAESEAMWLKNKLKTIPGYYKCAYKPAEPGGSQTSISVKHWPVAFHSAHAWYSLIRRRLCSPARPRTCWFDSTRRRCSRWSGSRFSRDQLGMNITKTPCQKYENWAHCKAIFTCEF